MSIKRVLSKEHYTSQKVPVKIWTNDIDYNTVKQLRNTASLPFIHKHIAAMPDVHLGKGATIGSVIPTVKAIIPAAVGVDIGCGMQAIRLNITANELPDDVTPLYNAIESTVPLGAGQGHIFKTETERVDWMPLELLFGLDWLKMTHPQISRDFLGKAIPQLGTLGSGNHFIEICLDEDDYVWIMLHSGSRGIGNQIGNYFIHKAKEEMHHWHIDLPDPDLAYLPEGSKYFRDYIKAVEWAQEYAEANRDRMMENILKALKKVLPEFQTTTEAINCHHNYISRENHFGENVYVTRKGAIRARKNDLGIIPGSMGTNSFIVRGLGNKESFCSCSHGAGRVMSRTAAKKLFTKEDVAEQTYGVVCRKDDGIIDEIPSAYKDIDVVMNNQDDLVEVMHTLTQIVNVKG